MLRLLERIRPGKRSREAEQAATEAASQFLEQTSESPENQGAVLVLLVPTPGGLLSFFMQTFASVEPAEEYLQSLSPLELSDRIVAFWALDPAPTYRGAIPNGAEAVVLVRDDMKADVVHLISFSKMERAQLFVDQEARRGLSLDRILVYWAALVSIEVNATGSVRMSPSAPPSTDFNFRAVGGKISSVSERIAL